MIRIRVAVLILLLATALGTSLAREKFGNTDTTLHVFEVGQGDSILLRAGNIDILIDGGPDGTVLQRLGEVRPFWDRSIEIVIITHMHEDHAYGILEVIRRHDIGLILFPDIPHDTATYRALLEHIDEYDIPFRAAYAGQRIIIGDIELSLLAPDDTLLAMGRQNLNNGSVVIRADIHGQTILLTGDIEQQVEAHMLRTVNTDALAADILQAPHHGSKTSSSEQFITAVGPSTSFASAGEDNRYGHPSKEVVERYERLGIRFFQTNTSGTITFSFPQYANSYSVQCTYGC